MGTEILGHLQNERTCLDRPRIRRPPSSEVQDASPEAGRSARKARGLGIAEVPGSAPGRVARSSASIHVIRRSFCQTPFPWRQYWAPQEPHQRVFAVRAPPPRNRGSGIKAQWPQRGQRSGLVVITKARNAPKRSKLTTTVAPR